MFVNLPDDLAAPYDYLNKEVFPSVFDMLVDAFRRHAQKLDDPESPSEAWRAEFAAISERVELVDERDARRHFSRLAEEADHRL